MASKVLAVVFDSSDELLEPENQVSLSQFATAVFDGEASARGYRRDGEAKIAIDKMKKQVWVRGQVIRNEQLLSNSLQLGQ